MTHCECCGDREASLVRVTGPRGEPRWVCDWCHDDHVYQPHAHDDED